MNRLTKVEFHACQVILMAQNARNAALDTAVLQGLEPGGSQLARPLS